MPGNYGLREISGNKSEGKDYFIEISLSYSLSFLNFRLEAPKISPALLLSYSYQKNLCLKAELFKEKLL